MVDLQTQHWQPKLAVLGAVVTDLDDIAQCITICLTTVKGSVPFDPDYGADFMPYLDRPIHRSQAQIVREAWAALEAFVPRAKIVSIDTAQAELGHLELTVTWAPVGGLDLNQSTIVTIGRFAA